MRYLLALILLVGCGPHQQRYQQQAPPPQVVDQRGLQFKVNNKDMVMTRSGDTLEISWKDSMKRAFPRSLPWDKSLKVVDSSLHGGWLTFKMIWVSDSIPQKKSRHKKVTATIGGITLDGFSGTQGWSFSPAPINGNYVITTHPVSSNDLIMDLLNAEEGVFNVEHPDIPEIGFQIKPTGEIQMWCEDSLLASTIAIDSPWKIENKMFVGYIHYRLHIQFMRNHLDSL